MKKVSIALVVTLLLSLLLCGCDNSKSDQGYILLSDLDDCKVGIVDGITEKAQVNEKISDAELKSFATVDQGVAALKDKKIDGLVLNAKYATGVLESDSSLIALAEKLLDRQYLVATFVQDYRDSDSFLLEIDATITNLRYTGAYDDLYNKYFESEPPTVADFTYNEGIVEGRVLTVGVAEDNAPFSYLDENGQYIGFDVEIANNVAKTWGAKLEIKAYPRGKLLNATRNGEVKMVLGRITKLSDEDKNDWMLFSQPYYDGSQIVIINRTDAGVVITEK